MFSSVTPSTAQLVVISGRYIPRDLYRVGLIFFIVISRLCTNTAIINIKMIVVKYSVLVGTNR